MKKLRPPFKPEDLEIAEDALTQLIKQLNIKNFSSACDITIENLRNFLIPVLEAYREGEFFLNTLTDIGEWLRIYIFNYYKNSDDFVSISEINDPLFPGLYVMGMIESRVIEADIDGFFWMAQEDVPLTLGFLKAPIEKQAEAYEKLWAYLKPMKWMDRAVPYEGGYAPMASLCGKDKIHMDIRRSTT
jgi:hypothetical protein